MTVESALSAHDLFRTAYENRYTWQGNFPGYRADFTLEVGYDTPLGRDGAQVLPAGTYSGTVTVPADLTNLNDIIVTNIDNPLVSAWITNQIKDVITHRKHTDFETAHAKHTFSLDGDADASGAVPIAVGGDAMGSHYKIRDREVAQVSRTMGRMAFTINHLESLDTGKGYLSTHYTAVFTDPSTGDILNQLNFTDSYTEIGGFWLMSGQEVKGQSKGQPSYTSVSFSNFGLGA